MTKKIIIEVTDELKHKFVVKLAKIGKKQKEILTTLIEKWVKK